jgi:hypothetical protein
MVSGQRWAVRDRYGHEIYLTDERWQHIIASVNHPEMAMCEEHLQETIRSGVRKQDAPKPPEVQVCQGFRRPGG